MGRREKDTTHDSVGISSDLDRASRNLAFPHESNTQRNLAFPHESNTQPVVASMRYQRLVCPANHINKHDGDV
jgi:hypothetical protein